ncbi:DUF1800 domain-containing protein [Psychroserpens sp. S379A]|uniref:DUF1800 domain-containing protein n=1 Tax=Psychroserpens sp. S379A TaxID=3415137 RepID=UPI003C7B6732
MKQQEIQHLYCRAGFGIKPEELYAMSGKSRQFIVNSLFQRSAETYDLIIDTSDLEGYTEQNVIRDKRKRIGFIKDSKEKLKDFNVLWFDRMVNSNQILREKMTLFWANHFVCRDVNVFHVQQYHNVLRQHALGDFGDFVKAVSKEAAMLKYLNNKQNRKQKPNENFARELMELFTLGEGNYSEEDIQESARAFTGYSHNFQGDFLLRKRQHDYGFKTFFGHTGRYDGDDIIDFILEQKQCARFICRKIYSYFVNDKIDENKVEELTSVFYQDYDIENVMRHVFMSDWFYNDQNIGSKIKSPIEFLVGITRTVPIAFHNTKDILRFQKLLGQVLLNPPNVAGWKGGKSWIDSNTIMLRLKLPSILLANAEISIKEKGEFEDSFENYYSKKRKKRLDYVSVNWDAFEKQYANTTFEELKQQIIIPKLSEGTKRYLKTLNQNSKRDFCVQLMSLPEYQMC